MKLYEFRCVTLGSADILTTKMLDLLTAAKVAYLEAQTVNEMKKGIDRDDEE